MKNYSPSRTFGRFWLILADHINILLGPAWGGADITGSRVLCAWWAGSWAYCSCSLGWMHVWVGRWSGTLFSKHFCTSLQFASGKTLWECFTGSKLKIEATVTTSMQQHEDLMWKKCQEISKNISIGNNCLQFK